MINVKNLSFSYGSRKVLRNISMELREGTIYGLLGENGVGKTTFLTLLAGLKKPLSGGIMTDGRYPFDRKPSFLEEQFYLPEEVAPVHATASDFGNEYGKLWPRYDHLKFLSILKEFEVESTQRMDSMSAGQLKKAWISFALACNVRYYFLDEPTNGLDIPSKGQFRRAITRHTHEDCTIVISTHQVRDLEDIIDPVVILDKEDVLLNASIEEITAKLFFDYGSQVNPDALYIEGSPSGVIQVYPNTGGKESKVNLEALFNAAYAHKDVIKALFR